MGDLKQKVLVISTDLLKESTKREQENKVLSEKITHVEDKIESLSRDNIKNEEKLNLIQETVTTINQQASEIKNELSKNQGENNIKKSITTIIVTFLITLFAGIIVALFQGWI